ncbi:MAG: 6-phosphogluconolactonase [Marinilabiliales bacterium]|nr:6-phosphogluconolactonase [Marinilabiliales bacterium]
MNGNVRIFPDPWHLADQLADELILRIRGRQDRRFDLALSGGTTPLLLFDRLAEKYPDAATWQRVHFWWADERMVPAEDPESNFGQAYERLFSRIGLPETQLHPIRGEREPLAEVRRYAAEMETHLTVQEGWPLFDLILLGMGEDGHTASLFPGREFHTKAWCEAVAHPVTGQKRITLTAPLINRARTVCFVVTGEGKSALISDLSADKAGSSLLPVSAIQPLSHDLHWYLDRAAAGRLA